MSSDTIAIAGAGEAGVAAAIGLRGSGWEGEVLLIGEEQPVPYERPPLSKISREESAELSLTEIGRAREFGDLDINHVRGVSVVGIDRSEKTIVLSNGEARRYSKLLLATGAEARRLTVEGGSMAYSLRTFADAVKLRPELQTGRRILIVGGGFIGLEIAAIAQSRGASVTVIEAAPRVLMRGVPEPLAKKIAERHHRAGVETVTGVGLLRTAKSGLEFLTYLSDGTTRRSDCVIAGIGAIPNVELAKQAGLVIDNGVAVDERLATTDPDIFAAGDCCSFPHPLYEGRRIRLEAWRNAQDQGAAAARSMLGQLDAYAAVPWFWSDQYDLHLQIAGLTEWPSTAVIREVGDGSTLMFQLASDGRIVAASGLGSIGKVAKDIRLAEMMIAKRAKPDPMFLGNSKVALKSLLKS